MKSEDLRIVSVAAPLRRQVEDKLRGAITGGRFRPGEYLVEREMCNLLNVSRTSVREALRQLEAEGLVMNIPNKGLIVTSVSAEEAVQIYQVREVLEGLAGRGFAERATDKQVSRLKAIVGRLAKMASDDSPPEIESVLKMKKQFYEVLLDGCGNIFARQLLTQLHNRIMLLRATSLSEPTRMKDSVKEIARILDAVIARDPEEAWSACIDHVNKAAVVAIRVLQREKGEKVNLEKVNL